MIKDRRPTRRETLRQILAIDCPGVDEVKFSICFKKRQWADVEFCYLNSKRASIKKYLGRELNESEKLAVELSKYAVLEPPADQSQLSLLGKKLQGCIDSMKSNNLQLLLDYLPHYYQNDLNYIHLEIAKEFKFSSFMHLSCDVTSVSQDVKEQAENSIKYLAFNFNSPLYVFKKVKEFIDVKILNNDLIEWFKANPIDGMNEQQLMNDLFENNKLKTSWIIYLLEKNHIIRKIQ